MKADKGTPELQEKRALAILAAGKGDAWDSNKLPDELQVQKLHRHGKLDIDQASAGIRLYALHCIANKQGLRAIDLSREVFGNHEELSQIDRMTAACRYMKIMSYMRQRDIDDQKPYIRRERHQVSRL